MDVASRAWLAARWLCDSCDASSWRHRPWSDRPRRLGGFGGTVVAMQRDLWLRGTRGRAWPWVFGWTWCVKPADYELRAWVCSVSSGLQAMRDSINTCALCNSFSFYVHDVQKGDNFQLSIGTLSTERRATAVLTSDLWRQAQFWSGNFNFVG